MTAAADKERLQTAEQGSAARAQGDAQPLLLNLEGYEGPLDVLLHLAQTKKLDLSKISVLALANQYLRFVEQAAALRLELAGEYLLMAAKLAYIKSRLLLPNAADEADEADESAAALQFRLARLAAMREAAENLFRRDLLGVAVFARGAEKQPEQQPEILYQDSLYALLKAYADLQQQRRPKPRIQLRKPNVCSPAQARAALTAWLRGLPHGRWLSLSGGFAAVAAAGQGKAQRPRGQGGRPQRGALAGAFVAGLELAREGKIDLRQAEDFSPLYLRVREGANL